MTELELYKFIHKNNLECRWVGNELLLWAKSPCLSGLAKLLSVETEDEVTGMLTPEGEIVFDLVEHCELHDINPLNISDEDFYRDGYSPYADDWREEI